jgi:hypothetical protein
LASIYKLEFHPLVNDDFAKAATYYNAISTGLFNKFKGSLQQGYLNIIHQPEHYFVLHKNGRIRRYHLEHFPYSIIYAKGQPI